MNVLKRRQLHEAHLSPKIEAVFKVLETTSIRETAALLGCTKTRIFDLTRQYPEKVVGPKRSAPAARRPEKMGCQTKIHRSLHTNSKDDVHGTIALPMDGRDKIPKARRTVIAIHPDPGASGSNEKKRRAGNAFLKRASSFEPVTSTGTEDAVSAIIFGCYLNELKSRTPHGDRTEMVNRNFSIKTCTAQRYRRTAAAVMLDSGLGEEVMSRIRADEHLSDSLVQRLTAFVGPMKLRQLYIKYGVL